MNSPGLAAPNVTVTSARTAGPSTAPVSASTPLGTSTATTYDACAAIASSAAAARRAPRPPMPTNPSTTRSASRIASMLPT